MQRRQVLAALGGSLAAGCTGLATSAGSDPGESTPGTDGSTPTTAREAPGTDRGTDTPPGDPECPSFAEGVDRTVCWRGAVPRGEPVYLAAASTEFHEVDGDDAVDTFELTLHNRGDRPFQCNPYHWEIHRKEGDGWAHVAPEGYNQPIAFIEPGTTYTWVLSTRPHPTPNAPKTLYPTVNLSSGERYAFRVAGKLSALGEESDATRIECVAPFDYVRAVPSGNGSGET